MITHERLLELVSYNAETGYFINKIRRGCNGIGVVCGTVDGHGYISIMIDRSYYAAHRLAWFYVTNKWPETGIDHRNRIRTDNSWNNLRLATKSENGQNQNLSSANTSGYTGVTWSSTANKWCAQIGINKRQHNLGYYDLPEDASSAYLNAKLELHKFNPVLVK